MIRFPPPPLVFALLFSLEETGTDQAIPTFWGLQNWFWRAHSVVHFPPLPKIARCVFQEQKFSPKRKFLAGYPCGHPAKNFGQALQILEKKQAFWNGHAARMSMKKLRSGKLQADFPFPCRFCRKRCETRCTPVKRDGKLTAFPYIPFKFP